MHYQYWPLQVTAPANTPLTAPVSVPWPIVQGHLKQIEVDIPAGGAGTIGLRVVYFGTVIFPWSLTGWLVPVRASYLVEWDDEIMATGLVVQAYNLGAFPHTTYWRAEVWPDVAPATASVAGGLVGSAASSPAFGAVAALVGAES